MTKDINTARINCSRALAKEYNNYGLIADTIQGDIYSSVWKLTDETLVWAITDNIFDEYVSFYFNEYDKKK